MRLQEDVLVSAYYLPCNYLLDNYLLCNYLLLTTHYLQCVLSQEDALVSAGRSYQTAHGYLSVHSGLHEPITVHTASRREGGSVAVTRLGFEPTP